MATYIGKVVGKEKVKCPCCKGLGEIIQDKIKVTIVEDKL